MEFQFLPAATKLGQGNIFTPVCDSVNRGVCTWSGPGGLYLVWSWGGTWQTPPGTSPHPLGPDTPRVRPPQTRYPLGPDPPGPDTPWTRHPPGSDTPWIRHPPGTRHPRDQTPPSTRHPLDQTPPRTRHPRTRHPPGTRHPSRAADSEIRSTSGRYASYWNTFLLNHDVGWKHFNFVVFNFIQNKIVQVYMSI